jgi:hypothetical protein
LDEDNNLNGVGRKIKFEVNSTNGMITSIDHDSKIEEGEFNDDELNNTFGR